LSSADDASRRYGTLPPDILRSMSGLDLLCAIREGRLPAPPISRLLGFHLVEVEHGRAVFAGTPSLEHYNPIGSVHGGYASTLLDSCMGCAVHSTLAQGTGYTTLELKVSLVRGMTEATGQVRAEGTVLTSGRRIGYAEGRLVDAGGKLLAHGTSTCLIMAL
jgi:uncharacterized protein (TIGR00369 family)